MPTFLKPLNGNGSGLTGLGVANLTALTGTPSATTFARGDGSWATPAAGGGAAYSATIGDGTTTAITVTHNLGTQDVAVVVREAATPYGLVAVRWEATTANTVTLQFTAAPTTGQYRASVLSGAAAGGGGGGGGGAPTTSTYVLNTADATLPNAQALGALATGLLKVTTTTGVLTTATGADVPTIAESQVTNLTTDLAAKAPLASPVFTGTVKFNSHYGDIGAATDGATVTFDLSLSDAWEVTLGGNRTLAVSNAQVGQKFKVALKQDATGSRTVTWWAGIRWPGGTAPTLTTTAGKEDEFGFEFRGGGDYRGHVLGLNF